MIRSTAEKLGLVSAAVIASYSMHHGTTDANAQEKNAGGTRTLTTARCLTSVEMTVAEFNQAVASSASGDEKLYVVGVNSTNGHLIVGMEQKAGEVSVQEAATLTACASQPMSW